MKKNLLVTLLLLIAVPIKTDPKNKTFQNIFVNESTNTESLYVQEGARIGDGLLVKGNATITGNLDVSGTINGGGISGGGVQGPVTSTVNAVARWANTTGDEIKDSTVLVDDSGNIDLQGITKNGNTVAWPSIVGAAGTFLGSDGAGNLIYSTPAGSGNVDTAVPFTTDNALVRVDILSGAQNIKESNVILDNSDNITGVASLTATTVNANLVGNVTGAASQNVLKTGDTMTGDLNLANQSQLRLQDAAGGEYIGFSAPVSLPSSYTLTFPSTTPLTNQILRTNSINPTTLEWITPASTVLPSTSRTIYVTKFGNDITGDGSATKPFASLLAAVNLANTLASASNPVAILISAGVYTENNSAGPITVTANGIAIVGESANTVIISPTTLSNNLLSFTVASRISEINFVATGISTASAVTASGNLNTSSFSRIAVNNFNTAIALSGTNANYLIDSCVLRSNGTAISTNNVSTLINSTAIQGTLTSIAANNGITITGANGLVVINGGFISRCLNGIIANANSSITVEACSFRLSSNDVQISGGAVGQLIGCSFQINPTGGVDISVSGAGSEAEIVGSYFDGNDNVGIKSGTAIQVTNSGLCRITGSQIENYVDAIQVGQLGDTSSTQLFANTVAVYDCDNDITQLGTTTLDFNGATASSTKISIADSTNVNLAYFDLDNNSVLQVGTLQNNTIQLLAAAIAPTNNPVINYVNDLYTNQAIGVLNPQNNPTALYVAADNDVSLHAITTDRTLNTNLQLLSDTGSPLGTTTALRGWTLDKLGTANTELAFKYQNNDTGVPVQPVIPSYTVLQLDGVNNQVQLPDPATQIVFDGDTNLYRGAANTLQTDDNLIIGGLTANHAVATNASKQLVSSVTTDTELGYLTGVTSAIQPQIDGKVSKSGDTMTGALQLPAGTNAAPSLRFTGSTTTGLSAASDTLSINTNGTERMSISSAGTVAINQFTSAGVVHNDNSGNLTSSLIINADVSPTAGIVDTKLDTIATPGKVLNSATTATNLSVASTIVQRDASQNFSANVITANSFVGALTGAASLNVLKSGDTMTGALRLPAGTSAAPSLNFTGSITTGISAPAINNLAFSTNGTQRMNIDSTGTVLINGLNSDGVVHTNASGELSTSQIVDADIANGTISNAKLATISSTNTPGAIVVRDGSGNFETNQITILGTVSNPDDAATKAYVDTAVGLGLVAKTPALVVSTTDVAITGLFTIDGVALAANDRVLLVGQTNPVENGLWLAQVGAWTRPADFANGTQAGQAYVLITSGTVNAGTSWLCNTPTAVIGTDPISFVQFSLPGQTTAANVGVGTGLIFRNKTANIINLRSLLGGTHVAATTNADDITLTTDATNTNTPDTIVSRDSAGDFSANQITAIAGLVGAASLNVLKTGDTMTGNLNLANQSALRLQDSAGGEFIGLQAPATVPSSYSLTLPSTTPTANQYLRANSITPTNLEWVSGSGTVQPAASRTIYVTKYGNDTTGDGSFSAPYASIAKAVDTANALSSAANPVIIEVYAGVYTENNSTGPILVTASNISIIGASSSSVIIRPNTLSNNLLQTTATCRISDLSFDSGGVSTATGVIFSGTLNSSSMSNVSFSNFSTGLSLTGTNSSYLLESCFFRTNTTGIALNNVTAIINNTAIQGSLTTTPSGTAITVTGASGLLILNTGLCSRCVNGISANTNAQIIAEGIVFRTNNNDVIINSGVRAQFNGCSFELNTSTGTEILVDGIGSRAEIVSCSLNGLDSTNTPSGNAITVVNNGTCVISGGIVENYVTGLQVGQTGDTSTTHLTANSLGINGCTTDIVQNAASTLNFNAGVASSSKISINDSTNVNLAFFDPESDNALKIGTLTNEDINLLRAAIATSNNPRINYLSSLYSTEAIGYLNPQNTPSTWFASTDNDIYIDAITTDRTNIAGLQLISDTGSPLGTTTALRGWDISKTGNTNTELAFNYQNSDTGIPVQPVIPAYTVLQLDGVDNQVQLPDTATQMVFGGDTNLYRGAANMLQTDGSIIIGALTANRAVATNGSKQLVSSTTTATELGYLSGVTSSIQPQIDGKVFISGDTMTGALQLPAGSNAAPSLRFTGSTTTGLSAASDILSFNTSGTQRMSISSAGTVAINEFTTAGVVHNDNSGNLTSSLIIDADVSPTAAIVDTKLATIATAGKVSNSATTATTASTPNTIVLRDGSGNITGNITGSAALNVLKAGDTMTGTLTLPSGSTATPSLQFTGNTNTGLSAFANTLTLSTNGSSGLSLNGSGVTIPTLTPAGVVHNDVNGLLTSSLIVNADISASAAIAYSKLNLSNSIVNNDINVAAAIAYSKLNLANSIVNADINASAAIVDTKLDTISTAGKVANSATTATTASTPNTIVLRDGSGAISGNITGSASLNVLKAGDTMTGTLTHPAGTTAVPSIQFTGSTNTGISAATANVLSLSTAGVERLKIDASGNTTYKSNYKMNAYLSANQGVNNTTATIIFNTEIFDSNANYNNATGVYTAPVTGVYLVNVTVTSQTSNQPSTQTVNIVVNGSVVTGTSVSQIINTNNARQPMTTCTLVSLTAGDSLRIDYTTNKNDTVTANDTHLAIHFMSF